MSETSDALTFSGLTPSTVDYPICSDILRVIGELAPSDSKIVAAIQLIADDVYHTILTVHGNCGPFQAEAKTKSLVSSLRQAQRSMLTIIADWKTTRF